MTEEACRWTEQENVGSGDAGKGQGRRAAGEESSR